MSTVKLKLKQSWNEFEKTLAWKIIFLVFDTLFRGISYFLFFIFVVVFSNHSANTKREFYGPMFGLLALILVIPTICASRTMSWIGVIIIDIVVAGVLVLSMLYQTWSEEYREKMGYHQWF